MHGEFPVVPSPSYRLYQGTVEETLMKIGVGGSTAMQYTTKPPSPCYFRSGRLPFGDCDDGLLVEFGTLSEHRL